MKLHSKHIFDKKTNSEILNELDKIIKRPDLIPIFDEVMNKNIDDIKEGADWACRQININSIGTEEYRKTFNIGTVRVFTLKPSYTFKKELHSNSDQRLFSYKGDGSINVQFEKSFRKDFLPEQNWHVVPRNTWHFPKSYGNIWTTITFHSAAKVIDKYNYPKDKCD